MQNPKQVGLWPSYTVWGLTNVICYVYIAIKPLCHYMLHMIYYIIASVSQGGLKMRITINIHIKHIHIYSIVIGIITNNWGIILVDIM